MILENDTLFIDVNFINIPILLRNHNIFKCTKIKTLIPFLSTREGILTGYFINDCNNYMNHYFRLNKQIKYVRRKNRL